MISHLHPVVSKLNGAAKQSGDVTIDDDDVYEEHLAAKREERIEFLTSAVPSFFFALGLELKEQIDDLNSKLYRAADRIQIHGNQRTIRDLLLTSNVPRSEWFNNETSLEVATIDYSLEVVETCIRPKGQASTTNEMCLLLEHGNDDFRIASKTKSFNVSEYATYLIERFLQERQLLRDPSEDDLDDE